MLPLLCGIIPLAGLLFSSLIFSTTQTLVNLASRLSLPTSEPASNYFLDISLSSSDFDLALPAVIEVYYEPTSSSVLQSLQEPQMYIGLPFPSELPLPPSLTRADEASRTLWHTQSVVLLCVATMIVSSLVTLSMVKVRVLLFIRCLP